MEQLTGILTSASCDFQLLQMKRDFAPNGPDGRARVNESFIEEDPITLRR